MLPSRRGGRRLPRVARYSRACSTSAWKSRCVLAGLWVPLDAHRESHRRVLDAFERSSAAQAVSTSPSPTRPERLVVMRRDVRARTDDRRETRALLDLDRWTANSPGTCLDVVADLFGKVLHEVSAANDVQQLEAPADREHGHVAECCAQQGELTASLRVCGESVSGCAQAP